MKNDRKNIDTDLFLIPNETELAKIIVKQIETIIVSGIILSLKNNDRKDNEIIENMVSNAIKCRRENNLEFFNMFFPLPTP